MTAFKYGEGMGKSDVNGYAGPNFRCMVNERRANSVEIRQKRVDDRV